MTVGLTDRFRRGRTSDLGPADLLLIRAALQAGAPPVDALAQVDHPALTDIQAAIRVGAPLRDVLDGADGASPTTRSLLRTLAMTEAVGASAATAVHRVMDGVAATSRLQAVVRTRSAQAVMSARMLVALPLAGAVGLAVLDRGARGLLLSPAGAVLVVLASILITAAVVWMRVLLRRVTRDAAQVDPLMVSGGPLGVSDRVGVLPTVELLELLAMALTAGLSLTQAVRLGATLTDPAVRPVIERVAARLACGIPPGRALPTELAEVGRLLDLSERFGAPTAEALRVLADDIRDRAAAAAETAAERLTVHLVFPTTLLLVPAFGLLVVVPSLASSLGGIGAGP